MARTNIVLDDRVVREALRLTGARSKREVVDIALRNLVRQRKAYRQLDSLFGKLRWEGSLDRWRKSRV